ncbi:endonuclease/exonuclease/phosphatase family protein [Halosimplex pelagicum]|uniref:Endonuclease/exonuclease/phosphatase family protein n=1 Tax=Halosimplex pelagicum TaxID=869886 RepID=A0A7D5T1T0_9EURY|nr:endonuclease/exonuclease/phosphatase family protein [Halosimplex pelagicum]QLH80651.1 endonuclease/exonuclease/phosphatase family protein [Halosimplex pelagicum]
MNGEAVRVLTYNVRRDVADDGEFDWAGRGDAVASTIRFHRPELVGLQEPLAHQYADLRDALPEFEWIGRSRNADEDEGEFCPVGYRRDRFERLDAGTFWLSPTPDDPGSVGWDAAYPRIAAWVRLRDRDGGGTVLYCNTHLDHEGARARVEGARVLRERARALREGDEPVVVGGDFNCVAGDEPYRVLADGSDDREGEPGEFPLVDAREASPYPPHGPDTTRTDFEELLPDRQIDHFFVADTAVDGYGVAADAVGDGWFPSDHLPVVVDLDLWA